MQNGVAKTYRDRTKEVLFVDLRQMGSPYEKKYIELTEDDRKKVADTYHAWQTQDWAGENNIDEYCYSAKFDEIEARGFSLVPSKYIKFVNRDENIDYDTKMKKLQAELTDLLKQEEESKKDLLQVFKELGYT